MTLNKKRTKRTPSRRSDPKPWEPNAEQLDWYCRWSGQHYSIRDIAKDTGHAISAVYSAIKKTEEWMRQYHMDKIEEIRSRQTEALESMCCKALIAWEESIGEVIVTTDKDSDESGHETTVKKEISQGNSSYLSEARHCLESIRKIWGVDKPTKLEIGGGEGEDLGRVAGMSREEALRQRAETLLARAAQIKAQTERNAE